MTVKTIQDVGFGDELEAFTPNNSLGNTSAFARAVKYDGSGRFEDHEKARELGLPGAIVPGIMGMAFLTSMIHRWAPEGEVVKIDTVFRAPMLADKPLTISAIVTDIDEDEGLVELDLTIKNAADETRVLGTANVRLPTE